MLRLDGAPDAFDDPLGPIELRLIKRKAMCVNADFLGLGEDTKLQAEFLALSEVTHKLSIEQELRR